MVAEDKTVRVDDKQYRQLVSAKGKMEMESGIKLSFGEAVSALAGGFLEELDATKLIENLKKRFGK